MLYAAVMGMKKLFELGNRRSGAPKREIPGNQTATMRALSDLGESIASGVHAIYSPVRLYLCVAMEPKPDALRAQIDADRRAAKGMFEVDENWSAAEINARWARSATLTDGEGNVLDRAVSGARGLTDIGAKEVFFEFGALETYPETMYLVSGETRVRVR